MQADGGLVFGLDTGHHDINAAGPGAAMSSAIKSLPRPRPRWSFPIDRMFDGMAKTLEGAPVAIGGVTGHKPVYLCYKNRKTARLTHRIPFTPISRSTRLSFQMAVVWPRHRCRCPDGGKIGFLSNTDQGRGTHGFITIMNTRYR